MFVIVHDEVVQEGGVFLDKFAEEDDGLEVEDFRLFHFFAELPLGLLTVRPVVSVGMSKFIRNIKTGVKLLLFLFVLLFLLCAALCVLNESQLDGYRKVCH